jgi:anti-sigma factor ChrR (cupin superfamily)
MLLSKELEESLLTAFENLDYRERAIVSEHLGFCPECFSDSQLVTADTGRNTKQRIEPKAFIDIAYDHGLASPSSADRIYRKALQKLRKAILEKTGTK